MKVIFKNLLHGYQGKADELVFYWDPRLQRILARRLPKVKINQHHLDFAATSRNLMSIRPSERYKDDLRTYAERTYNLPQFGGVRPLWNNLYMQVMYGLKAQNPDLDLQTISRAYIELHDLPCRSVARAVEAGLLPPVRGYEALDAVL